MKLVLPGNPIAWKKRPALSRFQWCALVQELATRGFNAGNEMEVNGKSDIALAKRRLWYPRFHALGRELAAARSELWKAGTPEQQADPAWVPGDRHGIRGNATAADLAALGSLDKLFIGAVDADGLPDPYEDFQNDYTEVDPNTHITTSTVTASAATLYCNESAYLYKNFGAGHFTTSFTHSFQTQVDGHGGTTPVYGVVWAVSNVVANAGNQDSGWDVADDQALLTFWGYVSPNNTLWVRDFEGGYTRQDNSSTLSASTPYYPELVRSDGSVTVPIYSDASRETLVDTLSITLITAARTYQYGMAMVSFNIARAGYIAYQMTNVDLHEAAAGHPARKRFGGIPFATPNLGVW